MGEQRSIQIQRRPGTIFNIPVPEEAVVGDVVYPTATGLDLALAVVGPADRPIGVIVKKPTTTTANVQTDGATPEVYTGLVAGQEYRLSDTLPGKLTTAIHTDTDDIILHIGVALTDKILVVNIEEGYEIDED